MRHFICLAIALLVPAMGIVGCETTKTPVGLGAVTGAAAGGVIGSTKGKAVEGALIGGAVGGVTGAVTDELRKSSK
jgi:uncharacterized membrane protein